MVETFSASPAGKIPGGLKGPPGALYWQAIKPPRYDWQRTDYGGPCPPIGRHRYFHKLYALDIRLEHLQSPSKAELEQAMQGHILAHAELVGTYQKER